MNTIDQLRIFSLIEDKDKREKAILDWWETLSDEEKKEVSDFAQSIISQLQDFFAPLVDALGEIARNLIQWLNSDPEIEAYRNAIEQWDISKYENEEPCEHGNVGGCPICWP